MEAYGRIKDMNDVALKAQLLRRVIRDHVPDPKFPSRSPLELSRAVDTIRTHKLLCESVQHVTDQKLIDEWKSAIDSWFNRLSLLISSDMPDKCWAGICLLGVTCQECSSERFSKSYSGWFQKLLSHIQLTATSQVVKVASCAAMLDLITRFGTANAGKLVQLVIQPLLKLFDDDNSEVVWEGAVRLLCTIISLCPSSIKIHYKNAEYVIASKILSGKCSVNMLKKLAHCLALLPKSRAEEDNWSSLIVKILLSINGHLNYVFHGFEEGKKGVEIVTYLVPQGEEHPPPLGECNMSGEASTKERKSSELLPTSSFSALMVCCCTMLTTSYHAQVTVPIRALLALIQRVLSVDGSLPPSLLPFVTATQQEFVCSELPLLHSYSLDLLSAIIEGARSQLLPHVARLVHLLSEYLNRCALSDLRIKVYSIMRILLISMGNGMAAWVAHRVVNSAVIDLNPVVNESGSSSYSGNSKPSTEVLRQTPQTSHRKRKHGTSSGALEQPNTTSAEGGTLKNYEASPIAVQIAALEALEALLTAGGALNSEGWRSEVDLLLINVARQSLKGGWAGENRNFYQLNGPADILGDMQLAALRAVLASFLSSSFMPSPYLAEGLDLFHRGKQEAGVKLAGFCAHALLALEVLIHPRVLPLADFSNATYLPDGVRQTSQEIVHDVSDSHCDHLYDTWETPVSDQGKTNAGESCKIPTVDQEIPLGSAQEPTSAINIMEMRGNLDENMLEAPQVQESRVQYQDNHEVAQVQESRVRFQDSHEAPKVQESRVQYQDDHVRVVKSDKIPSKDNSVCTSNPKQANGIAFETQSDSDGEFIFEDATLREDSDDE